MSRVPTPPLPAPPQTRQPAVSDFRLWTHEERLASMQLALAQRQENEDIWVFGYGSLIWRPEFEFVERRVATLHGYHRALCLWSRVNRGTPETPGLVFGLDRGGACKGVAYRLASNQVADFFPKLWEREMSTGAYLPRWQRCSTEAGPVSALAFVMNRGAPSYISALPREELLAIVRRASGKYGACTEYVVETEAALRQAGIRDRQLESIARALLGEPPGLPGE
jgi:cation transport protein ChaC